MHVVEVSAADDPRLEDYRGLTDVALRRRTEPPLGLFIAEGELVIRRALAAGYALRSVLLSPRWLAQLADIVPAEVPVYVGAADLLEEVTGFHVHRGALAAVRRRPLTGPAALLSWARRVVVLEDINTHTNVGAIFRGAAALGMDAVLLSPCCADPLYRRAVRVSMGAVFTVPYARADCGSAGLAGLRDDGFRLLALTPDLAATRLDDVQLRPEERAAVLLGAEGAGLSHTALSLAEPVRIPMAPGVDSLNVAAAAAVAFWVLGRR